MDDPDNTERIHVPGGNPPGDGNVADWLRGTFGQEGGRSFNDVFGDLFGTGKPSWSQAPPDPRQGRIDQLLATFRLCAPETRERMGDAVNTYLDEVNQLGDERLYRAHALACLYAEKQQMAYDSLHAITGPADAVREVMGLLAHQLKDYFNAVAHLNGISPRIAVTPIALAVARYETGQREPSLFEEALEPLLEERWAANAVMAAVYQHAGRTEHALEHARRAAELQPRSQLVRLNLLRLRYASGGMDAVAEDMPAFYSDFSVDMPLDEMQATLEASPEMPSLRLPTMYDLASKLLR